MSGPSSVRGWYAVCAAYLGTPVAVRRKVSRQTLATYRRIRRFPEAWGDALDCRQAPLHVMRSIAWENDPAERERRFLEAITTWDQEGRWPRWSGATSREDGEPVPEERKMGEEGSGNRSGPRAA